MPPLLACSRTEWVALNSGDSCPGSTRAEGAKGRRTERETNEQNAKKEKERKEWEKDHCLACGEQIGREQKAKLDEGCPQCGSDPRAPQQELSMRTSLTLCSAFVRRLGWCMAASARWRLTPRPPSRRAPRSR
eukprot:Hpha_TRINITY_DN16311_c1_g4::TRINITY_DN16311_c1_g4_i1::g.62250::m.62250